MSGVCVLELLTAFNQNHLNSCLCFIRKQPIRLIDLSSMNNFFIKNNSRFYDI